MGSSRGEGIYLGCNQCHCHVSVLEAGLLLAAASLLKRHNLDEEGVEAASRRRCQP
jgi:hypothetical protein